MVEQANLGDKVRERIKDVEEEQTERRTLEVIGDEFDAQGNRIKDLTEGMDKAAWLQTQPIRDHETVAKLYAQENEMNLTEAKKTLFTYPERYEMQGSDVPKIIKQMRYYRRTLKGDIKLRFTKSIDDLIDAYSDYLNKCVDSIYWVKKYKQPLRKMHYGESHLEKLNNITDETTKRDIIDSLCKFWEADLDSREIGYGPEFTQLTKEMTYQKRRFKSLLKGSLITSSPKEEIKKAILKSVCKTPGISSRQIHDSLPKKLNDRSSPQIISKLARDQNITSIDGAYYKLNDDIKKNLWAYTAAFIDSDGYITMDKSHNPRVGLVATGNRGKAFMLEMHKSLGFGRLHLDQKSPQDTRLVNRLNFYSAGDIKKLLTKCRPHFKMKGPNADVLLELIKIKKNDKKEEWYPQRKDELFKLMKYHNHSDNTKFDWKEWDIDINNINKLIDNNKMEA